MNNLDMERTVDIKEIETLIKLRGRNVDTVHLEPISGDLWWLKPLSLNGNRIGITDCCQYDYECDYHKEIRRKLESQKSK